MTCRKLQNHFDILIILNYISLKHISVLSIYRDKAHEHIIVIKMSSSEAPAAVEEVVKESTPPKPAAVAPPTGGRYWSWGLNCSVIDVALRVLLFAATLVSLVVMVTSDQSKLVPLPQDPTQLVKAPAKFKYSSAFM